MKTDRNIAPTPFSRVSTRTHRTHDEADRKVGDRLLEWLGSVAPRSRVVRIEDVERNGDRLWKMLTFEEREHVARCRSARRRLELMGSRGAAKMIVQAYIREVWNRDLPLDSIRVAKRPSGTPLVVVPILNSAAARPPRLSLTHNRSYCWAALVGDRFRIGVDVQEVEPRIRGLTSSFLADSEMEIARKKRAAGKQVPDALYTAAWSAKEAAFKCVGRNVSFRKFCTEARIARMDENGTVLTRGSSSYFVHQILNSENVFSIMSTPDAYW